MVRRVYGENHSSKTKKNLGYRLLNSLLCYRMSVPLYSDPALGSAAFAYLEFAIIVCYAKLVDTMSDVFNSLN
jgi:hypothetical protein